jgi:hypothetical protein
MNNNICKYSTCYQRVVLKKHVCELWVNYKFTQAVRKNRQKDFIFPTEKERSTSNITEDQLIKLKYSVSV